MGAWVRGCAGAPWTIEPLRSKQALVVVRDKVAGKLRL